MDKETGLILGKILGEIYRIQRSTEGISCSASDSHIFALLHGFEHAAKEEIERLGFVSEDQLKAVMDVLEPIWLNPEKLAEFKGFYDIERTLKSHGVDRSDAIRILTYLNANGQFTEVIDKMDSSGSPSECRKFDISKWY
jgi:hypothetical protein